MTWVKIDDGFATHPKLMRLSRADRWTWVEVLCYCARYRTQGRVPEVISEALKAATPAFLNRCYELHLLDLNGDGYVVHDWAAYNPKDPLKAQRQARWRAKRDAAVDTDVDDDVDASVDAAVDAGVDDSSVSSTVYRDGPSRAAARARPVPSSGPRDAGKGRDRTAEATRSTTSSPSEATSTPSSAPVWVCPHCGPMYAPRFASIDVQGDHLAEMGWECGHDGWVKGCPLCERNAAIANERLDEVQHEKEGSDERSSDHDTRAPDGGATPGGSGGF